MRARLNQQLQTLKCLYKENHDWGTIESYTDQRLDKLGESFEVRHKLKKCRKCGKEK